jgi:hypothetical protein
MKKTLALLALAALAAATLIGPATVASAGKKKTGPVVVGTDPAGDWGSNQDAALAPAGDPLGQDLVSASIGVGDKGMLNFVIELNALPPTGGMPEFTRYTWDFTVDGELMELDGKFTNYSRGTCDPTSGQCPPPRDPGMQPFLVRGNCTVDNTTPVALTLCEEFAKVQGIFDAAGGTITIPVPIEALGAKAGSKIVGALGTFGSTISAAPAAFVTNGSMPMDGLITTKTFTVPK